MLKSNGTILKALAVTALIALVMMQLSGCNGSGSSGGVSAPAPSGTGTLKLAITDKQSDAFAKVVISIREIRIVPAGRENAPDDDPRLPVVARFESPKVIDVMLLQFVQQTLGEVVLPAGTYNQIRLILEPNPNGQSQEPVNYVTLRTDPDSKHALKTPSGQTSGLKILGHVVVNANVINAVMIDFDPNSAIVVRGNGDYILKPTGIRIVRTAGELTQFGSISGSVISTFKDWSSATVSVRRRGAINDADPVAAGKIFSNYSSGMWQAPFAVFVPPGASGVSYKTFVSANSFRLYSSAPVGVTEGQTSYLGDITLDPLP